MSYSEEVRYVVYKNKNTNESFAIKVLDSIQLDEISDRYKFSVIPDHITVEGYSLSLDRKNGMHSMDLEHITILKVKDLSLTSVIISE